MRSTLLLLSSTILFLSACATSSKVPSCPKSTLGQCLSMGEMNELVDRGIFDDKGSTKLAATKAKQRFKTNHKTTPPDQVIPQAVAHRPLRRREQTLQIWLAPYEDNAGNYIGGHSVFTVVAPAKWIGLPPVRASQQVAQFLTPLWEP